MVSDSVSATMDAVRGDSMSRKEMDEKIESKLKRGLKPNGESSQVERSWKHKKGASLDLNVYPGREHEK